MTERQRYYQEYEDGHHRYIRLYPSGTDEESIKMIEDFNKKRRHINRTFVLDTDLASRRGNDSDGIDSAINNYDMVGGSDPVFPMYDMVDVHVKSANECNSSSLKRFDAAVTRKREDIYLPQLNTDPIGGCQIKSSSYMLTEATNLAPGMLESSLHLQRMNKNPIRTYTVQIKSENTRTYLYRKTSREVTDKYGNARLEEYIDV